MNKDLDDCIKKYTDNIKDTRYKIYNKDEEFLCFQGKVLRYLEKHHKNIYDKIDNFETLIEKGKYIKFITVLYHRKKGLGY